MLIKPGSNLHEPLPDGRTHPSISLDKVYIVVTLVVDDFRIVDDQGEPILVPRSRFEIIDDWIPADWIQEADESEGWSWSGPPQCAERGFFERWHDGGVCERQIFADVYMQLWHHYQGQLGEQELVLKR